MGFPFVIWWLSNIEARYIAGLMHNRPSANMLIPGVELPGYLIRELMQRCAFVGQDLQYMGNGEVIIDEPEFWGVVMPTMVPSEWPSDYVEAARYGLTGVAVRVADIRTVEDLSQNLPSVLGYFTDEWYQPLGDQPMIMDKYEQVS